LLSAAGGLIGAAAFPGVAKSQARTKLKLGIISDLSGPNRDNSAPAHACALQGAVRLFGKVTDVTDTDTFVPVP
jgi:hypothetical protein